jgi:hypothetical protein
LNIPDLLEVVKEWDGLVRTELPEGGYWFAPFSCDTGEIDKSMQKIGDHREALARKNLRDWMTKAGLTYHSPHKFRHGNVQYGLAQSRTIADFKAVSQNVMHSSMKITDEIYSVLDVREVQFRIAQLGNEKVEVQENSQDVLALIQEFLQWRKNNRDAS